MYTSPPRSERCWSRERANTYSPPPRQAAEQGFNPPLPSSGSRYAGLPPGCVGTNGRLRLLLQVSMASWFSVDIRMGSVAVTLEPPKCFAAEMYAAELGVQGASDELKVRTAMKKLRIAILGGGTARQKMALE
jgi:hypothetical protein